MIITVSLKVGLFDDHEMVLCNDASRCKDKVVLVLN
jgi:hypothetical protein